MAKEGESSKRWTGAFGAAYTERNRDETIQEVNAEYKERFGVTQTTLFEDLFDGIDRNARILEVGCGVGVQLEILEGLGFDHLYGLDLQRGALKVADRHRQVIRTVQGAAQCLPFDDNSFDIVCTIGVLIHIPPDVIEAALDEIVRCSKRWIIGSEYYAPTQTELLYRGQRGVMWKNDFSDLYTTNRNVELVDAEIIEYMGEEINTAGDQFRSVFCLRTEQ